jgi:hypothetical protein
MGLTASEDSSTSEICLNCSNIHYLLRVIYGSHFSTFSHILHKMVYKTRFSLKCLKEKKSSVESLQSHMILTMSHWSSGLTCLLPSTRVTGSNPLGGLMWNRDSPVSVVSLHWWPRRDWSSTGLRPQLSLGPHIDNVTVPLDLTQPSCPGFTLAAGLPSGFTTDRVVCWGGALWRACNLTWFSPCLTGPLD